MAGFRIFFCALASAASALLFGTQAAAYLIKIDQFTVVRNGATIFDDTFSDGNAPPSAPDFNVSPPQPANYFTTGIFTEAGGKATMDSALGGHTVVSTAHSAILNTNVNSANTTNGLKANHLFSVTGLFDLSVPDTAAGQYGIRLTDGIPTSAGNDTLDLLVRLDDDGEVRIVFRRLDLLTPALTVIDSALLDTTLHEQIRLTLSRLNLADNDITASFAYVDGGVAGATTTFANEAGIFNGELFTRAAFLASELTPVPEPATLALLGAGLVGLGWARRRRA